MNTLFIILQQTQTGAILEIILLLIIAGVIGYLTAFFYYKSVYTKKINILNDEKAELNKQIHALNAEKEGLEEKIKQKDSEIASLKKTPK